MCTIVHMRALALAHSHSVCVCGCVCARANAIHACPPEEDRFQCHIRGKSLCDKRLQKPRGEPHRALSQMSGALLEANDPESVLRLKPRRGLGDSICKVHCTRLPWPAESSCWLPLRFCAGIGTVSDIGHRSGPELNPSPSRDGPTTVGLVPTLKSLWASG
jgi:hypothetical protein